MPASVALRASRVPTWRALAFLSPSASRMLASRVEAEASVWPLVSSTICANMCREDRFTTSRGRCGLPVTFLRTRRCRLACAAARALRCRPLRARADVARAARATWSSCSPSLLPSLPDLAANLLALVTHALALVRVRLAQLVNLRRDLAHLLLVDALDHESGRRLDAEADALGRRHGDRVAVPEG